MTKWNYTLSQGKHLRELINEAETDSNSAEILRFLRTCCEYMMKTIDRHTNLNEDEKNWRKEQFEEVYDLLDGEAEAIEQIPHEITSPDGWGYESIQALVDDRLA